MENNKIFDSILAENNIFEHLYHGSKTGKISKNFSKYNCFYCTPSFAYAAFFSTEFKENKHGCVYEIKFKKDLKIFDANNDEALEQLKNKVQEMFPDNDLINKIKWEDLKTKDWSTVCFRKDDIRDKILLTAVEILGYDGYVNIEFDDQIARQWADGEGGTSNLINTKSIGIFNTENIEIVDTISYDDYFNYNDFEKCYFDDLALLEYEIDNDDFEDEQDIRDYAQKNLLFLDLDIVQEKIDYWKDYYEDND